MKDIVIALLKELMDLYIATGDVRYMRLAEKIQEAYNEEFKE